MPLSRNQSKAGLVEKGWHLLVTIERLAYSGCVFVPTNLIYGTHLISAARTIVISTQENTSLIYDSGFSFVINTTINTFKQCSVNVFLQIGSIL